MREKTFVCACHSKEHQMTLWYDNDEKIPLLYTEVHLASRGFFKRLQYGLLYIFGYRCRFGCFEEFIFENDQLLEFKKFLENET